VVVVANHAGRDLADAAIDGGMRAGSATN